jgi:hypothetical protein
MPARRAQSQLLGGHEASLFIVELSPYLTLYALHPESNVALSMVVQ